MTERTRVSFRTTNGVLEAKMIGLDMPWAKVVAQSPTALVIKIPGHTYAIGAHDRSYAKAQTVVLEKLPDSEYSDLAKEMGTVWWRRVIEFDSRGDK